MSTTPRTRYSSTTPRPRQKAAAGRPPAGQPGDFVDRQQSPSDVRRLAMRGTRSSKRALEFETDLIAGAFAGKSTAVFRRDELEDFVAGFRRFATGEQDEVAVQGGQFSKDGRLMQVYCGLYLYRRGGDADTIAARIVVAAVGSDDLLTVTIVSRPDLIAQFVDEIDCVLGGAGAIAELHGA